MFLSECRKKAKLLFSDCRQPYILAKHFGLNSSLSLFSPDWCSGRFFLTIQNLQSAVHSNISPIRSPITATMTQSVKLTALLTLSHELGDKRLNMAIFGEGNTSAKLNDQKYSLAPLHGAARNPSRPKTLIELPTELTSTTGNAH